MNIAMRSREAADIDNYARSFVDHINRDKYEGRMPSDVASEVYRQGVCVTAQRAMFDELAPVNRVLTRLAAMSIDPLKVPPAVEEMRQGIINKWSAVVAELVGPPLDTRQRVDHASPADVAQTGSALGS